MEAWFADVAWAELFQPQTPLLEVIVRGTVIYLMLLAMLRIVLKRERGGMALTDLLVVVLVADAAQGALDTEGRSIFDALLLVATILFWDYSLNWLGFHFPLIGRFVHPQPLPLIRNGRLLRRNMRVELVTEEELRSLLRRQGLKEFSQVREAYMEGDGSVSILPFEEHRQEEQREEDDELEAL
ncbi:MAG: DUF421 domain-containing protein [Candidatus Promineifilaceae bacterium]|nr:DUF421 domain-containing protein [Candidatus Promineifilaceae bacterium]